MAFFSPPFKRKSRTIVDIIFRNTFLLINGIISVVVGLLIYFGDTQEGVFLGFITLLNIVIGCVQEINAWRTLERLQLLVMPRMTRINKDGSESLVLVEEVAAGDRLKLKAGDQIPSDGKLIASHGFEINEALITGESKTFFKNAGDDIFAGSLITAGSGIFQVDKIFAESRIALMTKSIKTYTRSLSPIQLSINRVIRYTSYVLLAVLAFVLLRGYVLQEPIVGVIQSVGALTSVLLPQGMILVATLLFTYGAAHLYRRSVLLQEVNATEKIGRIKNLCMDKTGTLTDNNFILDKTLTAPGVSLQSVDPLICAYIKSSAGSSKSINAIASQYGDKFEGEILEELTFSSSRQFGAVRLRDSGEERVILAGSPDIFLPCLTNEQEKQWLRGYVDAHGDSGDRLICLAQSEGVELPKDLSGVRLRAIALFVLTNGLREGVREAIEFFQNRNIVVRIISGDNAKTVQTIATRAGVHNPDRVITGAEVAKWSDEDYHKLTAGYTIFARIKPEQKEKIIEVLKEDGFTAMVGDGANDALAIKKADLGIAMFDGAQATRQLAPVVLVKNSFTDLPNGVRFADSVIQNIEIYASTFFNQTFLAFFLFVILAFFGKSFPFTPLNITFINYFTIGLPGFLIFYWVLRPVYATIDRAQVSFLRRILPFAALSAIPQMLVVIAAYYISLSDTTTQGPNSLVAITMVMTGVVFFFHAPMVYSGPITQAQRIQFILFTVAEIVLVAIFVNIGLLVTFYNLTVPSLTSVFEVLPLVLLYGFVQYWITKRFFAKKARLMG